MHAACWKHCSILLSSSSTLKVPPTLQGGVKRQGCDTPLWLHLCSYEPFPTQDIEFDRRNS